MLTFSKARKVFSACEQFDFRGTFLPKGNEQSSQSFEAIELSRGSKDNLSRHGDGDPEAGINPEKRLFATENSTISNRPF